MKYFFDKGVNAHLDMKEHDAKRTWTIALDTRVKTTLLVLILLAHTSVLVAEGSLGTGARQK